MLTLKVLVFLFRFFLIWVFLSVVLTFGTLGWIAYMRSHRDR